MQIVRIQEKGIDAFTAGLGIEANPYNCGYRNNQGNGGNLQRQRREAWLKGWQIALKEATRCLELKAKK